MTTNKNPEAVLPRLVVDTIGKRSWRDVLPIHPACELFPALSEAELREIGEDIKRNGLTSPVVILKSEIRPREFEFSLLDGRSRLDEMTLVGIDFEIQHYKRGRNKDQDVWEIMIYDDIPTPLGVVGPLIRVVEVDPYQYVVSANLRRRHLTSEKKRKLIENLLKAQPEISIRQVTKQAKVSPTTATKVKRKLEATGDVSTVDTSIDTKGRKQPARKPSKTKASTTHTGDDPFDAVLVIADHLEGEAKQLFILAVEGLRAGGNDIDKALPTFLTHVKNNPHTAVGMRRGVSDRDRRVRAWWAGASSARCIGDNLMATPTSIKQQVDKLMREALMRAADIDPQIVFVWADAARSSAPAKGRLQ